MRNGELQRELGRAGQFARDFRFLGVVHGRRYRPSADIELAKVVDGIQIARTVSPSILSERPLC
jgi:hypothetical protein